MGFSERPYYKNHYDLKNCNKEPLHLIRRVQDYGSFLSCDRQGKQWFHASEDLLMDLKSSSVANLILQKTGIVFSTIQPNKSPQHFSDSAYNDAMIVHTRDHGYLIEIEKLNAELDSNATDISYRDVILKLSNANSKHELIDEVIHQIHKTIKYDHIMVYKFDSDSCGEVIAEKKDKDSPAYLGLKFPATDIPEPARKLYFKEKVRIIHNAKSDGHVICANDQVETSDLDLSRVTMRGVSPIHREYLRNMNVSSSFSVAIIRDNKLWGLIACHNKTPKLIPYNTRVWLNFLSDLISTNLSKIISRDVDIKHLNDVLLRTQIKDNITSSRDLIEGLLHPDTKILELIPADGMIIKSGDAIRGIGELPSHEIIDGLADWLVSLKKFEVKSIEKSKSVLPEKWYSPTIAGMLILQVSEHSRDYIIWTRKEKIEEILWGGNPNQTKTFDSSMGRLTPRKSFESWKEVVNDKADKWSEKDIAMALSLKKELKEILYEKFNEVVLLNTELKLAYEQLESFSYSISHDLRAPLRSIESYSEILKEDYSANLGEHGLNVLNTISTSIYKMKELLDGVLNYSKQTKKYLEVKEVNPNQIIQDIWQILTNHLKIKPVLIFDYDLPKIYGDYNMINQLFLNLFSNALKYTAKETLSTIKISHRLTDKFVTITMEDNGIGIPENQREKVFEIFRRLNTKGSIEGTGIGLSIVKKVVERHSGNIRIIDGSIAETGVGFKFSLPIIEDFMNLMNKRNSG